MVGIPAKCAITHDAFTFLTKLRQKYTVDINILTMLKLIMREIKIFRAKRDQNVPRHD